MTILSTFGGASGAYTGDIPASLRFRKAGSCYIQDTPGAANSRTIWTYSVWFKRGELGTDQLLLDAGVDGNNESAIWLNTSNKLDIYNYVAASYGCHRVTTAVLRDPSSWNHLVVASNGTTSFKIWLNGVEITAFDTTAGTNGTNWFFNSSSYAMHIGRRFNATNYFDGEQARICWVGGSALTAADFGYQNTEINEWVSKSQSQVKAVVDAGDSNSFMLDFDDGTSLTTLGYDKSSKGNNWTLNNFSLTAGTSYDWMLDVPGNSFATLNPIIPSAANITNGNLTSGTTAVRATMNALAYDSKWEVTAGGSAVTAGVISATGTTNTTTVTANKTFAFRLTTAGALDYKNVTDAGSWTSITTGLSGEQYPYSVTQAANWNFGQAPLHASATYQSAAGGYFYDTTTGYKALCQRNMPDVAILNPEKHFDVVTRTGTAATYSVAGLGFQPDLVWVKSRGRAVDHALYDSVRGVQKQLESNQTGAETTETTGVTAFNSDGYTGGALDQINGTTATNSFVDWLWKAGGTAVTNNAGSISSQVSANVEAGFSIVTFTSQPSGSATVGHGLGKVPGLIITKHRNLSSGWQVYHAFANATPQNGGLILNSTAAYAANSNLWNNTAPTTSVFTSGAYFTASEPIVAYCFAEIPGFSKIFSYTGNGSADGPFVHCGFKPKFILYKRSDAAANWVIWDAIRSPENVVNDYLLPNSSGAEATLDTLDIVSNGFKLRTTNADNNGGTIVGIAFADVPAKYSLAR